jgi:hypothetical protein
MEMEIEKLEKKEKNENEEDEEDREINRILCKAAIVQAMYAVYEDRVNWDIILLIDDLEGFGKTMVYLPKSCLDRNKLLEFIEEVKKRNIHGD